MRASVKRDGVNKEEKRSPCTDQISFNIATGDCEETAVDLSIRFS